MDPNDFDDNIGVTAGDSESWKTFSELLYPVVNEYHGYNPLNGKQLHDFDPENLNMSNENWQELFNAEDFFVVRVSMSASRNFSQFPFPAGADSATLQTVRWVMEKI